MAEREKWGSGALEKGAVGPITIEEALPHILVVTLEHEAKTFRGVLMDSTNRDLSFGLGFNHLRCGNETPRPENRPLDPSAGFSPGHPIASPAIGEVSALSLRQTYVHGPDSTNTKLIPPPRVHIPAKPVRLRDKSIRKMRLRPRQILCTKCKQGIHESKVLSKNINTQSCTPSQAQSNNSLTGMKNSTPKNSMTNCKSSERAISLSSRDCCSEQQKRKLHGIKSELEIPLKKLHKPDYMKYCDKSKASPAIKISFTSPKGEGTVVKIPRKSHLTEDSDSNTSIANSFSIKPEDESSRDEYRRLKKALKKARKEKPGVECGSSLSRHHHSPNRHHHKKSKRSKHRKKHKHKENEPEDVSSQPASIAECDVDSDADLKPSPLDTSYIQKEFEDRGDSEWALTPPEFVKEDILDVSDSLKENSRNSTYQARLTRTFLRNPDGSSYGLSHRSTSSGNSDHSSVYDENSNSDFNEDDPDDILDPLQSVPSDLPLSKDHVKLHPLMMRIHTRTVSHCQIPDGRTIRAGDVVWGKILGFPWWPGKIISINLSQRDNGVIISQKAHIAWFGSSTMSNIPCEELFPFLEDFKIRFNKKKRGAYKVAIKQATLSAEAIHSSRGAVNDLEDIDMDFED